MSGKIDTRIVEMQFNNQQFTSGVKQTISSLDQLKSGLNLDSISSNVENISSKFSALGAVAFSGINKLTGFVIDKGVQMGRALVDPIVEGGRKRALNIEQAKFQFAGLGLDIEKTMESARFAVTGTAYGLDEAAKIAGILGTSGMQAGAEMTSALRAVAGTAAMSGAGFMEVGDIFTDVFGKGKAQAEDFNRLAARGVGGAAIMAKEMGVTQAEVLELASKGKISAEQFATAMDKAFGKHATKANETYTGSLSNMRAALARIGAVTAAAKLERHRDFFNALTPVIDNVAAAIKPLQEAFNNFKADQMNKVVKALKTLSAATINIKNGILKMSEPVKAAFDKVFPPMYSGISIVERLAKVINKLAANFNMFTINNAPQIENAFTVLFSIVKMGMNVFKILGNVVSIIGKTLMALGKIVAAVLSPITSLFSVLFNGSGDAFVSVNNLLGGINEFLSVLSTKWGSILDTAASKVRNFIDDKINGHVREFAASIQEAMLKAKEFISVKLAEFGDSSASAMDNLRAKVDQFKQSSFNQTLLSWKASLVAWWTEMGGLSGALGKIGAVATSVWQGVVNVWNNIGPTVSKIAAKFKEIRESITDFFKNTNWQQVFSGAAIGGGLVMFIRLAQAFHSFGSKFRANTEDIKEGLFAVGDGIREGLLGETKASQILKFAAAIGILAVALYLLSDLEWEGIGKGLTGMSGALAVLLGGLYGLTKVMGPLQTYNLKQIAMGLLLFSAAIWVIGDAFQKFRGMNWQELAMGMAAVGIAIGGLLAFTKMVTSKDAIEITGLGLAMISFAAAIWIMSYAVKAMSDIPTEQMLTSLSAIIVLMAGLTVAMHALDKTNPLKAAFAMTGMAVALGMLVGVLYLMSLMDHQKLSEDLGYLALMIGALTASMAIVGKFSKDLHKGALAIMSMAIAIGLLVGAVAVLGLIPMDILVQGLSSVLILIMSLSAAMLIVGQNMATITGAAAAFIAMAVAIDLLVIAIYALGILPFDVLIQGMTAVIILLAALVVAASAMTQAVVGAGAMIVVAGALLILSVSLLILSAIPFQALMGGLIALAIGFGILLGAAALAQMVIPGLFILAAAIAVIGVAVLIGAVGVMIFSAAMLSLVAGAAGAAGAILILANAAGQAGPKLLAMVGVGAAMIVLGVGFMLAGAGAMILGVGLMSMGIGMTMLVAVGTSGAQVIKEMTKELAGLWTTAPKLLVVTASLLALGAALLAYGLGAVLAAAGTLALSLALLLLSLAVIPAVPALQRLVAAFEQAAPMVPVATQLGIAMMLLGRAAGMAGISIMMLTNSLQQLSSALTDLGSSVMMASMQMTVGFALMLASAVAFQTGFATASTAIISGMSMLAVSVSSTAAIIQASFIILSVAASSSIGMLAANIRSGASSVTASMMVLALSTTVSSSLMVAGVNRMSAQVSVAMLKLAAGVKMGGTQTANTVRMMSIQVTAGMMILVTGVSRTSSLVITAFGRMVTGVSSAMSRMRSSIVSSVNSTISSAVAAVNSGAGRLYSSGYNLGLNMTRGMAAGLSSGSYMVRAKAAAVASAAYAAAKAALDVRSPSKKFRFLADMSIKAMVIGFSSGEQTVYDSAHSVGENAIDGVANALAVMADSINEDLSGINPVISPELDLSGVEAQSKELYSMLGNSMSIGTTADMATGAASTYDNNRMLAAVSAGTNETKNIQFNQYNSSPKTLSNAEIYRRTKNQIAVAAKKLGD